MKKYAAAIFDMDGTLINNASYHYKAFEVFCEKYHLEFNETIFHQNLSGKTNEMILNYFFGDTLSDEQIIAYTEEKEALYRSLYKGKVEAMEGLETFLDFLYNKNIPCGIATNGPVENIFFILDELKINQKFKTLVNAKSVADKGKPAPDMFLLSSKLLGVPPNNCLVFEDSKSGLKAGLDAGMDVFALLTSHSKQELDGAKFTADSYRDLGSLTQLFDQA